MGRVWLWGGILGDLLPVTMQIAFTAAAARLLLVTFQFGRSTGFASLRDTALFGNWRGPIAFPLAIPVRGVASSMAF